MATSARLPTCCRSCWNFPEGMPTAKRLWVSGYQGNQARPAKVWRRTERAFPDAPCHPPAAGTVLVLRDVPTPTSPDTTDSSAGSPPGSTGSAVP